MLCRYVTCFVCVQYVVYLVIPSKSNVYTGAALLHGHSVRKYTCDHTSIKYKRFMMLFNMGK